MVFKTIYLLRINLFVWLALTNTNIQMSYFRNYYLVYSYRFLHVLLEELQYQLLTLLYLEVLNTGVNPHKIMHEILKIEDWNKRLNKKLISILKFYF